MVLNTFKSVIFPLEITEHTGNSDMLARVSKVSDCNFIDPTNLKQLSFKQMFQRLPS